MPVVVIQLVEGVNQFAVQCLDQLQYICFGGGGSGGGGSSSRCGGGGGSGDRAPPASSRVGREVARRARSPRTGGVADGLNKTKKP